MNEIYESLKDDSSSSSSSSLCGSLEGTDVSSNSSLLLDEESSMDEQHQHHHQQEKEVVITGSSRQIISFGDSSEERTAVNIVSGQLDAVPKSVMFMNSPSPAQIIGQLHMLTNHMDFVCHASESLDLKISKEQADQFARTYLDEKCISFDEIPNYVPSVRS